MSFLWAQEKSSEQFSSLGIVIGVYFLFSLAMLALGGFVGQEAT